jgi:hypothetical protein
LQKSAFGAPSIFGSNLGEQMLFSNMNHIKTNLGTKHHMGVLVSCLRMNVMPYKPKTETLSI